MEVLKGEKCEKVMLRMQVAADIFILPPMIIFRGESNLTMEDIVSPEGFVIFTQEKAWMDGSLMFI